jgi:hypothetical protein
MLEAKIRRDLAARLTEAEIQKLIRLYRGNPSGMAELIEKLNELDAEREQALAGVTDPAKRQQIERVFEAQRRALEYRGPA